jgi:hypothetical protein
MMAFGFPSYASQGNVWSKQWVFCKRGGQTAPTDSIFIAGPMVLGIFTRTLIGLFCYIFMECFFGSFGYKSYILIQLWVKYLQPRDGSSHLLKSTMQPNARMMSNIKRGDPVRFFFLSSRSAAEQFLNENYFRKSSVDSCISMAR